MKNEEIYKYFDEINFYKKLFNNLMVTYEWNNLLHNFIEKILYSAFDVDFEFII